jgi:hypothetical protein
MARKSVPAPNEGDVRAATLRRSATFGGRGARARALQHDQRRRDRAALRPLDWLGRVPAAAAQRSRPPGRSAARGRRRPVVRLRPAARRGLPRRAAVHPRHPPDRLPHAAVDDAHVRRLRRGRGHQRALPPAAARRPDRAVDRLRHAHAVRLRHRRPGGRRRVRHVRRGRLLAGRHGGAARRPAARPRLDVDDDQLAGRADLGDVHRRRREARRSRGRSSRARSRTTSSRSTSPRRSSSSRPSRRCAW